MSIEYEALARELLAKENRKNIVMEVFDHFSVNCINSRNLDSEKLDALIEEFNQSSENIELLSKIIATVHAAVQENEKEGQHFASRITQYLDEHYTDTKTVCQIASELNISYYYFSHFVKEFFGISVSALRNKIRVCKAKIALVNSDTNISTIATECGFDSVSYFTEVFNTFTGMTPRSYRARYADKVYLDYYNDDDIGLANMLDNVRLTGNVAEVDVEPKIYSVSMPDEEYKFLHEAAIIDFNGTLFASWYNCHEKELSGHTPIRGKRSFDGGKTWSDVEVIEEQANDDASILYCPPVYGICDGKLYLFINEMVAPDYIHALNLYVFDENQDKFVKLWSRPIPFKINTNVVTLANGKLMLPGRCCQLDSFPNTPAVLISDSGKIDGEWRLVKIAENGDLPDGAVYRHPEISAIVSGETVTMFCRNDKRKPPIVYFSHDNGESWSAPYAHDIPFSPSKMYAGTLSDGRKYVVGNIRTPGKHTRARLAIYTTEKGSDLFSKMCVLANGEHPDFKNSGTWHYPFAIEQNGRLKIICTVSFIDHSRGAVLIDVDTSKL